MRIVFLKCLLVCQGLKVSNFNLFILTIFFLVPQLLASQDKIDCKKEQFIEIKNNSPRKISLNFCNLSNIKISKKCFKKSKKSCLALKIIKNPMKRRNLSAYGTSEAEHCHRFYGIPKNLKSKSGKIDAICFFKDGSYIDLKSARYR